MIYLQTFLPYADFGASARVLDMRRLGKQRVEVLQILNALDMRLDKGWKNHPATKMWSGHSLALIEYGEAICTEWIRRGYRDTVLEKLDEKRWHGLFSSAFVHAPAWLGDEDLHLSHQSNLVRKDPEFYTPKFPGVPSDLPYVWPV